MAFFFFRLLDDTLLLLINLSLHQVNLDFLWIEAYLIASNLQLPSPNSVTLLCVENGLKTNLVVEIDTSSQILLGILELLFLATNLLQGRYQQFLFLQVLGTREFLYSLDALLDQQGIRWNVCSQRASPLLISLLLQKCTTQ